ncbi:MAG: TetR family transcriptional regulator [Nevskia sp.]|nr:TetR family transcriptional regulator [Nevskia sp.]
MSADKVRELIEFEIRDTLAHPQRMRLITREVSEKGHAGMRRHARRVFQRNFTAVVSLFEQGRTTGEFRQSIDPAAAATLLGGATYFFFACREALHEFSETSSLESPETYAQRIAWLILSGVLSEPRPHGSET